MQRTSKSRHLPKASELWTAFRNTPTGGCKVRSVSRGSAVELSVVDEPASRLGIMTTAGPAGPSLARGSGTRQLDGGLVDRRC
jgi:hypothetical protein